MGRVERRERLSWRRAARLALGQPSSELAEVLTIYTYAKCSTCRAATQWLRAQGLEFEERPIREAPPSVAELKRMLAAYDGHARRLFNTSGLDYRAQKLNEKLPALDEVGALALLRSNGNLVKRPFLLGPNVAIVGFDERRWKEALSK